ncbi:DUF3010 family protein [Marinomonas epiphytica]
MITCGVDIKSNEAILCLLDKQDGLFQIIDCRQVRHTLGKESSSQQLLRFQSTLKKLFEDYQVEQVVIRERPTKGKFAGSAIGFKIEAAIQLIDQQEVHLLSSKQAKENIKDSPLPISFKESGLKAFQENAFMTAYAALVNE